MGCCLRRNRGIDISSTDDVTNFKDFTNIHISNYNKRISDLKSNQIAPKPPTPTGIMNRYIEHKKLNF